MNVSNKSYALFFDIDGTLVSFQTHEIPSSTILALTQAKANGSRVYIATGRPPLIITNLKAIEHFIDGYVTTNGALCYVRDELVDVTSLLNHLQNSKGTFYEKVQSGFSKYLVAPNDIKFSTSNISFTATSTADVVPLLIEISHR